MNSLGTNRKVAAIVPAYNESARIVPVLEVLLRYPRFAEIIIIDDGSTDDTERVVGEFRQAHDPDSRIRYEKLSVNRGKGYAMEYGVHLTPADVIFFSDADIAGLTPAMIDEIVSPVVRGEVEMFIGMRNRKIYALRFVLTFVPLLGGERAVTRRLWEMLPPSYKHRFRIEAGLNFYAKMYGNGFRFKVFDGLLQTVKERKYGFLNGVVQRLRMFWDILVAEIRLQLLDLPKTVKNRRAVTFVFLQGVSGFLLGVLMLVVAYVAPDRLLRRAFAAWVASNPHTPVRQAVLSLVSFGGLRLFIAAGAAILVAHLVLVVLSGRQLSHLLRVSPITFRELPPREPKGAR